MEWEVLSQPNHVDPLSNRETNTIVVSILDTHNIDDGLKKLILERTEGVPFFIEEFIKSLRDMNLLEYEKTQYYLSKDIQEIYIPSTVKDIIMARVDSLPEGAKELLQTGSVV
jgi:predicted ATPase